MIIITGDSHTTALAKALRSTDIDHSNYKAHALGNGAYFAKPFFRRRDETIELTNDQMISFNNAFLFKKSTFRPAKNKKLVLSLGFYSSRITKHSDWKHYAIAGGYKNAGDSKTVPRRMVEAVVQHDLQFIGEFYGALKAVGLDVIAVPAPPPSRRLASIKQGVPAERVMEIDRLYQARAKQYCADAGVPVLDRPSGCTCELGLLLEEYCHEKPADDLHAGQAYALKQAEIMRREVGF